MIFLHLYKSKEFDPHYTIKELFNLPCSFDPPEIGCLFTSLACCRQLFKDEKSKAAMKLSNWRLLPYAWFYS
jgi:hypothetical protein